MHASSALAARADLNLKLAHHDARKRKFLLILRRDAPLSQRASAGRTRTRQWRLIAFIDVSRPPSVRLHAIAGAGFASRKSRMSGGTAGLVQLSPQSLVLASQFLVLALQPLANSPFVVAFPFRALDAFAQTVAPIRSVIVGAPA